MGSKEYNCPLCNTMGIIDTFPNDYNQHFYECNICGRFAIPDDFLDQYDKDKLASYLFYNQKIYSKKDNRFFYYFGTEKYFQYLKGENPYALLVTLDELNNWYPLSFSLKIDYILLALAHLSKYSGDNIILEYEKYYSLFFIIRFNKNKKIQNDDLYHQFDYLVKYLRDIEYIQNIPINNGSQITILPNGWKRIDDLQKNQSNNKQAFIAMQFGEETKDLREALRKGIEKAGYIPFFIDEKQHNSQIVPEILYEIKNSKFLVAEFSDNNNGAYYEAGYAAGLGKEVIHVCSEDKFNEKGHFDIKQKSSILYKSIDEIPNALHKRIEATII
jgi:nucleoside 2-deoxyribosyltransferase